MLTIETAAFKDSQI